MKRFAIFFVLIALVIGAIVPVTMAQDAPEGTWLGTWPYTLPPDHHLNGFSAGGLNDNLGMFRTLVELTPAFYMWADDEYVGLLADSWGFVDDGAAYEFTLKPDLTWSNGSALNADDVITTYALGRLVSWTQFNYIDEVEKVDDLTVRFQFIDEPTLLAEQLILREWIVASDVYGEWAQKALDLFATGADSESEEWAALETEFREFRPTELIASGPYTYSVDEVGDSSFSLNWQPNSIFSDSVQFGEIKLWAGETDATTPLVLSGEIAHATNVYPPATVEQFVAEGIDIVTIPRGYGPALLFNHAVAPWDVKEVRQAVALVIERNQNAFLTNGLGATGTVYMSGLLDSSVPTLLSQDVIDQLDRYEFNPDRAAALLESVGYSLNDDGKWADADGNTLSAEWVFPAEFADFAGASQDAIAQMNDFGFDITARALPWQEVPELIRNGDFELSIWSWGLGTPFAARQFWNPLQRWITDLDEATQPGLGFEMHELEWNNAVYDLDDMINQTSAGLDTEAQKAIAGEVALMINDLMPYVPLNIILSAEPFNTSLISGKPADDDPILKNPSNTHSFVLYYILTGVLGPAS